MYIGFNHDQDQDQDQNEMLDLKSHLLNETRTRFANCPVLIGALFSLPLYLAGADQYKFRFLWARKVTLLAGKPQQTLISLTDAGHF